MRFVRSCLPALVAAVFCTHARAVEPPPLAPDPRSGQIAQTFAEQFPALHLSGLPLDAAVSCRAWTNFITALDAERVYFLASDIERFRSHEPHLAERLRQGDAAFAFGVFEVFRRRVRDRSAYADSLLATGFDFQEKESYVWRRKDLPWPADEGEWDDVWRRRIKNQYLRIVVARETGSDEGADDEDAPAPKPDGNGTRNPNSPTNLPPPREMIHKQYSEFRTLLDDSDAEWVFQRYLTSFAQAYDPHSEYMSPTSLENFNIDMKLSLEGIGALLRSEDGAAAISELVPGGPADRDKREIRLRPGDKIIAVGQGASPPVDILHWPLQKVVALIRGPKGTTVVLIVIPASDPSGQTTKRVDLVRDRVKLEERAAKGETREVKGADGATRRLAVITVPQFYANVEARFRTSPEYRSSADDVSRILRDVSTQDVAGVLLDLRNNGGGYLPEAVKMAGLFIRSGPMVQVQDREGVKVWRDSNSQIAYAGPLAVLVNRVSASASEIVAGALQDYGRAVIIGDRKTLGKGTVQRLGPLSDDPSLGSLKVTNASYYRVSGGSTQLKGVTPDVILPSLFDGMEFGEEFFPNPMPWSRISPADFAPAADLTTAIPVLRKQSEERRERDSRFGTFRRIVERTNAMSKRTDMPLNMDERRALAREEKELVDLQNKLTTAGSAPAEKNGKKKDGDLILDEALAVLSDLVTLQPKPVTTDEGSSRKFLDSILNVLGQP
jgi:carboxyl-terminal processing protease